MYEECFLTGNIIRNTSKNCNVALGDVYSIQHYVMKLVSDLQQAFPFHPPIGVRYNDFAVGDIHETEMLVFLEHMVFIPGFA